MKPALAILLLGLVQGYREGYGRHLRKRREAKHDHGSFWGLVTVLGALSVKGTLDLLD